MKNTKIKVYILLFLIIALGAFLRTYNIDNAPPGIYPDEAVNGEDALRANETGDYQWFYTGNQGREGLFMNLIALCFQIFGASILALKLPAIIFGTLTVWGVYLLGRELFNSRVGLIGSFLTAISFWAINFSRISFRANMLPFVLVFSFYFIFKGLRTKKYSPFVMGGIIFGLGMHTYIAFRIAPAILIITAIALIISHKNFLRQHWRHISFFIAFAILSASPMLYTFYIHPEYLESRSTAISVFSPEVNQGHPILTFLRSFSLSLLKYTFIGDMNWRHNYPPYPILDPLTGLTFLFGIIFSIKIFFKTLYSRISQKISNDDLVKYAFLLSWFLLMLAPEFLTAEGNPHALRSIGTLPVVMIFAAIGFDNLLKKSEQSNAIWKKFTFSMLTIVFIGIGIFNSFKYHIYWANQERVAFSFNKNLTDISRYANNLPPEENIFVITSGNNTLERLPIYILNSRRNIKYINANETEKINQGKDKFTIILTGNHKDVISALQNRFPDLKLKQINETLGSVYYILK